MTRNFSAAMIVAHPGHELRLHGWMERVKPRLFVISDGAARSPSRIPATRALLAKVGGTPGGLLGRFTDAEVYRAIMRGDVNPLADTTRDLGEEIASCAVEQVVCDAWEGYNPAHDLCRVISTLAVTLARTHTGRAIPLFDYAVVGPTGSMGLEGEIVVTLDDASLARKLSAARAFDSLQSDVDEQLQAGPEAFRIECLRPVTIELENLAPAGKPEYERFGERRVADGRYGEVLRYQEHFAPFVEALAAAVISISLLRR